MTEAAPNSPGTTPPRPTPKSDAKKPAKSVTALAQDAGLTCVTEAFADRGYRDDGTLVPRSEPGAVLHAAGDGAVFAGAAAVTAALAAWVALTSTASSGWIEAFQA